MKPTQLVVVDRVDRPDYTATVHVSNDQGKTWQDSALVLPTGNKGKLFAPNAAFDGHGILYVEFVTLSGPGNGPDSVWIERSSDGGMTFDQPSQVAGAYSLPGDARRRPQNGPPFRRLAAVEPIASASCASPTRACRSSSSTPTTKAAPGPRRPR